jgi:dihydrodipicolinate synthase/N-acetylneuraminate lyase
MDITYYLIGLVTGVSVTSFFIGKELYKYYTKCTIQQKQLDRILKLNDKIKEFKKLKALDTSNISLNTLKKV